MELLELHRRAVEGWQRRVEGVPAGHWGDATPCTDWDVRALVNHLVGEDRWTRPLVEGATIADVGDRFDGDLLGDDPVAAAAEAARDAVEAVGERLPHGGVAHLSFGDAPMEEYVWQLTADHLIHAWDLAAATGQDRDLDPVVVTEVAAWFGPQEDMMRQLGVIGPRPEVSGASAQDALLAASGRDPAWHV